MVVEPVVVVVVPACTQLVYALAVLWTQPVRERARAHALATVVRAAGPGGTVEVTRADGEILIARSAAVVEPAGAERR
ncbi:hypothetical protein OG588_42270 [Streptomyces prunicolor]|uniref:hypothetical protein n=1 Tax=Streptomyces prunicolor TaxID=67348 RepID=UPI00386D7AE5|nr:hypothetical protein OG588_42270 [Streptomyces prunicolor]